MPRLVTTTTAVIRRFARESRGAAAVEFAIVAIPLLTMMFGVLELALLLLVSSTLDSATDFAARNIRTGEFQSANPVKSAADIEVTRTEFAKLVCRNMTWLQGGCEGKLIVEAETFDTFAGAGGSEPADPQNNPAAPCWSVGAPEDIVLVRTYYEWQIISPLLQPIFQSAGRNGKRLLSSARIFSNEPYNAALTPRGAACI
ncbi:MAG: pilus assembly protein TadE [Phenylobacterium sp.]|nr:pilus assembly protein TadE [Phenylobacterium sp.]